MVDGENKAVSAKLALGDLQVPVAEVIDLLVDAICVVDRDGRFLYVSAAFEQIFGYAPGEIIGRDMIDLVHPDDRERTLESARSVMAGKPNTHFENRYVRKDGQVVHVMWSARWSSRDQLRIAVARDVTARKRAEAKQASLYDIAQAAQSAEDLIALYRHIHDIVGRLLPANNFFVALYDRKHGQLSFPYHVDQHDQAPPLQSLDSDSLTARVVRRAEPLLITPETRHEVGHGAGHPALDWLGVPLVTPEGVTGALVVQSYSGELRYSRSDMELLQFVSGQVASAIERKQLDARLRHSALHDHLTDLPNRQLLQQRLEVAMAQAESYGHGVALLYIDLDDFKKVNDTLGHATGDALLRQMAERLNACVRRIDTVARMGGDEFVILLAMMESVESMHAVADKVRDAVARPFALEGRQVRVTASIGSAMGASGDGIPLERLLMRADQAMYRAKGKGGDQVCPARTASD